MNIILFYDVLTYGLITRNKILVMPAECYRTCYFDVSVFVAITPDDRPYVTGPHTII